VKRQEARKDSLVSKEVGGEDRGRVGQLGTRSKKAVQTSLGARAEAAARGNGNAFVEKGLEGGI